MPFTATYMKGRGNYLCLHRFEAWRDSGAIRSFDETQSIRMIDDWSRDTETGDRAELEDLPEDSPFWNDISASAENCIGAECPRYDDCFVTRMRQRAAASDVVIVNHHLCARTPPCGTAPTARSFLSASGRSSTRRISSRTSPRSISAAPSATTASTR